MSPDSIIAERLIRTMFLSTAFLILAVQGLAQRVAVLTPDNAPRSIAYATDLATRFERPLKILDRDLADAAFRSLTISDPFNMTLREASSAASAIGCDYLVLVRTGAHRRTSLARDEYYETFAFFYLVDGRTGSLIGWTRETFQEDTQTKAEEAFKRSTDGTASRLSNLLREFIVRRASSENRPAIEEVPLDGTPAASGLKPPIPYKRIKPEYPPIAFLYEVKATIDVEADIGANGEVLGIHIVRWAGFDLEAAVEKAIREMNWRPAMRNGKALPMRILLRYNFTKVEKEP